MTLAWRLNDDVTRPLPELVQPQPTPDPALALAPILDTDCPVCCEPPEFCPGTCGAQVLAEMRYPDAPTVYFGRRAA